jgi:hypothetical protein
VDARRDSFRATRRSAPRFRCHAGTVGIMRAELPFCAHLITRDPVQKRDLTRARSRGYGAPCTEVMRASGRRLVCNAGDGTPCDSDRLLREVPGVRDFDCDGATEASTSYGSLGSSRAIVTVLVAEPDGALGNPDT